MRMTVAHRQGLGGTDEGLTFDITTAGPEDEGNRILRFDCFYKNPHYHVGPSGGESAAHKMKNEGIEDPVRWNLEQRQNQIQSMHKQDAYDEIAAKIDQQAMADQLTQLEPEILAKYRSVWSGRESAQILRRDRPKRSDPYPQGRPELFL